MTTPVFPGLRIYRALLVLSPVAAGLSRRMGKTSDAKAVGRTKHWPS
jgi:hypothetical protein